MNTIVTKKSNLDDLKPIIEKHIYSLPFPIDSYLEDEMFNSDLYEILLDNKTVGYYAIVAETLNYFYVSKPYYVKAPNIFEDVINKHRIKKVMVISNDPQMNVLLVEWDYEIERAGCFFIDSEEDVDKSNKIPNAVFRVANINDIERIYNVCGDFFDEPSGGFQTLEDRIKADTIFILEESNILYGCGIIEKQAVLKHYTSIGMFTNPNYRKLGVAKTILLSLKDWVYKNNLIPVSGCWYYNTLSRKSLESAGMIVVTMMYYAKLLKKDNLPKRTGNPPGILVD